MKIGKFSPFSLAIVLSPYSKPGDEERGWKGRWLGRSNPSSTQSADESCLLLSWPGRPAGFAGQCSETSRLLSHEYIGHNFPFGCLILSKSLFGSHNFQTVFSEINHCLGFWRIPSTITNSFSQFLQFSPLPNNLPCGWDFQFKGCFYFTLSV